jgi:hypothetical protein
MTRSILAVVACSIALTVILGSGGCTSSGVGDPCTPEEEYDPSFTGFAATEVNVESRSFQCQTRLCLVNHFQGRVSCPYGQQENGAPNKPETSCGTDSKGNPYACCIPGLKVPITGIDPTTGMYLNPSTKSGTGESYVAPQCLDRTAADAVYCSCRCANINGQTNDGANYCTCPDGFGCEQLISSIGVGDEQLTGAYCVKKGTDYDPGTSCMGSLCDPSSGNCGAAPGVTPKSM